MTTDEGLTMSGRPSGVPDGAVAAGTPPAPHRYYFGVAALTLAMALGMLDQVIVGTALPTIVGDLGGLDQLSWVVTAYLVATSATTPIWGKLGDLYGRRTVFAGAVGIFLAGSVLSGLSQNMTQLVGFRTLQGLGAGGLMVSAFALIGDLVTTPAQRAQLLAVVGVVMPASLAGGPLLGGFITQHASWRWAFYINLPLGIVALAAAAVGIPTRRGSGKVRIDYLGAALMSGAIIAFTLMASWAGTRYDWGSAPILALATVGLLALAALVLVERRVAEPILPPRLFHSRDFNLVQVLGLLVGADLLVVMVYLPLYMQDVQYSSPTFSGVLLLPFLGGMICAELVSARTMSTSGRYRPYPIVGAILAAVGMLGMLVLGTRTSLAVATGLPVLAGVGIGLVLQSGQVISLASAERRDLGAASGLVNLFRTIGGSFGVALLGSFYSARLNDTLTSRLGDRAGRALAASAGQVTPGQLHRLPAGVRDAFQQAVSDGLHAVVVGASLIAVLVLLTSLCITGHVNLGRPAAQEG